MKVSMANNAPSFHHSDRSLGMQTEVNHHHSNPQMNVNDKYVIDKQKIETAVENLNDFIEPVITNLKFVLHEDLHEYYVTIVNPVTDEVIREIPPKKLLDMYAAMAEYIGLLVDEKI